MNTIKNLIRGDKVIWIIYCFLMLVSIVSVSSAGATLTYKTGNVLSPIIGQLKFLVAGLGVVILFHRIPCRFFKMVPIIFLPISFMLIILTKFIGHTVNGAQRWINLFGIQFQPSELAKFTVVTTAALILAKMQQEKQVHDKACYYIMAITGVFCLLIFQDNISTSVLLFGVIFLMLVIGRVRPKLILIIVSGMLLLGGTSFVIIKKAAPDSFVFHTPFLGQRMLTAKNRLKKQERPINPKDYDTDTNGQKAHANIAIATSNGIGKGPGNSEQRDFLSQAYSDFIYAIIIEEYGIAGALAVFFAYVTLLIRAGRIASRCERNFPAFLCMGLALLIAMQAFLNMMVATGVILTGQPLPLISRGGTSIIFTSIYFAIILSVSQTQHKSKTPYDPFADKKEAENDEDADEYTIVGNSAMA